MANKTIGGLTTVAYSALGANAVIEVEDQDLSAPKSRKLLLSALAALNPTDGVVPVRNGSIFDDSPISVSDIYGVQIGDPTSNHFSFSNNRMVFWVNSGSYVSSLDPATGVGATPYLLDTTVTHTSGDLLSLNNNANPRFTVDFAGTVRLWDSSTLQPVTFGAADSAGTGYRALRIPN